VLVNVPASRIFGLESDVTIRPTRNLILTGSVTYLDTRIQRYSGIDAIGNRADLAGNNLPFAPELSYNIDAEYRGEFANGGTPFIGISVTGQSSEDTTIGGSSFTLVPGPLVRIEPGLIHPYRTNPYATVDLRVGYEAPGSPWSVMLFGKNIFNKYYWNNVNATETIVRFQSLEHLKAHSVDEIVTEYLETISPFLKSRVVYFLSGVGGFHINY
jgi:iron complex outermembrane receptor protein